MGESNTKGGEVSKLPVRRRVKEVVFSRYSAGQRPTSWDDRRAGIECIVTSEGETILLESNGQQSSPAPFWELLLTGKRPVSDSDLPKPVSSPSSGLPSSAREAYTWTLYGIGKGAPLGRYDSE